MARRVVVALLVAQAHALLAPPTTGKTLRPRALRARTQPDVELAPEPLGPANAVAAATLAGLVAFAFGFAPGELNNPADVAMIERLVTQPVPRPEEINELWFAVWNCFTVVPAVIGALAVVPSKRGQRLPAAPFLFGAGAFGYFALGPYFSLRSARTSAPLDPELDLGWAAANIFERRVGPVQRPVAVTTFERFWVGKQ